jgi:arylsulfatase A-like enzyme
MRAASAVMLGLAAAVAILLVSCSRHQAVTTVLADYDFGADPPDAAYGGAYDRGDGLHWFESGWAEPVEPHGLWSLGHESTIRLRVLGRRLRLHLECSTSPELADSGQALTIIFDDRPVTALALPGAWNVAVCDTLLAARAVAPGEHELTFRASRAMEPGPGVPRRRAIFYHRLVITADLDESDLKRWRAWNEVPPQPAAWEPAVVGEEAPSPSAFDPLPDVLLVVLDAAGAHHFGCYGYARSTSPEIDALAADGVVMRQVYSDAPFTPLAVASLLTGLSFREHHLMRKGQALADSFTTLPEILRGRGYYTAAYSDNLYVTEKTGLAQGFDMFRDVWYRRPPGRRTNTDPELAERLLLRDAERESGDRPAFVYLHMLPPHSPYIPGPAHDIFSDPHYDGDIDGSAEQLQTIVDGQRKPTPADRDELEALYDGSLHRIDASVGRIIRGWRALGRDRELLVVVTADHGEAFGEHGRFCHLTTVYDEMLHVPLVLWPARLWQNLAASTNGLYGIEDVAPLLLGRLALAPPPGTRVTRRFLSVLTDPGRPREEIVSRTLPRFRTFGLRTERWLTVYGELAQELYDLAQDPGAHRNLRRQEPEVWHDQVGRLRAILAAGRSRESVEITLTAEERDALRSLGY